MKIDIKDLLDDYDGLVKLDIPDAFGARKCTLSAQTVWKHKNQKARRTVWIAAALLLVVTMCCAVPFVSLRSASTQALQEGTLDDNYNEETLSTKDSSSKPEPVILTSSQTDVELSVPQKYVDDIVVDEPYTTTFYATEEAITYDPVPYAYYDYTNQNAPGLVWAIYVCSYSEQQTLSEEGWDDFTFIFNRTPLGYKGDKAYVLLYYSPLYTYGSDAQYDSALYDQTLSYYQHLSDGYEMLKDFVERNALEQNKAWINWEDAYWDRLIKPVEENLAQTKTESSVDVQLPAYTTASPTPVPSDEVEAAPSITQTEDGVQIIHGEESDTSYYCYGNLLCVGSAYYTMTDNGPVPLETKNLHTTVELYGTWEVDIDYAFVDGELVLHNNTSTARYTIVDGQEIEETEYFAQYGEWPETVYEPSVAVASPVEGSTDTVMLQIIRQDAVVSGLSYPFFYNILTGEISDPLSNVPKLFQHTYFSGFVFNSSRTRALVTTSTAVESPVDGSIGPGNKVVYVCDLTTGTMTDIRNFLDASISELDNPNAKIQMSSQNVWADDDTFLCWVLVSASQEDDSNTPYYSMYSYNLSTGTLNYCRSPVGTPSRVENFNQQRIYEISEDNSGLSLQLLDSASGETYDVSEIAEGLGLVEAVKTRALLRAEDGTLYIVDAEQKSWANLTDQLSPPEETIVHTQLVTDEWLCLSTEDQVYCYHIPSDIPMTPLTQ